MLIKKYLKSLSKQVASQKLQLSVIKVENSIFSLFCKWLFWVNIFSKDLISAQNFCFFFDTSAELRKSNQAQDNARKEETPLINT
jgi:hypothetical protein